MKNKPLQQNLDVRGIRVYGQYRFSISNTKNCVLYCTQKVAHGFGLFKLIWENIL